jgi:hypothetical protein
MSTATRLPKTMLQSFPLIDETINVSSLTGRGGIQNRPLK